MVGSSHLAQTSMPEMKPEDQPRQPLAVHFHSSCWPHADTTVQTVPTERDGVEFALIAFMTIAYIDCIQDNGEH